MHSINSINTTNEHGRSTVEIIGVLAVIGVLSIGGIVGYNYGMDKYHANQAINDISLRGIDIISKTQNGEDITEEDLDKIWQDKESTYPTSFFYEEEYDRFGIQITGVPSSVCRLIGDNITSHIEIRIAVEGEEHEIHEHIEECDLSNDNTMFFFFEERHCVPECHSNEQCIDGKCYGVACITSADCNLGYTGTECSICQNGSCKPGWNVNGKDCTFDDGTPGQCNTTTCVPKAAGGCTYDTNICDPGIYCASPNTSAADAFPNGETGSCVAPRFDSHTINVGGKLETWYLSETTLSYWDALAACQAKDLIMVSVNDWVNNWNSGEGNFTRNDRAKAFVAAFGSDVYLQWPSVWTTSQANSENFFYVDLTADSGLWGNYNVSYAGRNQTNYYNAACKEKNDVSAPNIPEQCTYDTNPCPNGYYCTSPNTSLTTAFPNGETGSCVEPQFDRYAITVNGTTETWYISRETMSYWDASAACATRNLTMLPATSWVNNWTGEGTFTHNERAQRLAEAIGAYTKKPKVWTTSETTNRDGLPVFYWVNITDKGSDRWNVSWAGREHSQTYFAACKE